VNNVLNHDLTMAYAGLNVQPKPFPQSFKHFVDLTGMYFSNVHCTLILYACYNLNITVAFLHLQEHITLALLTG